MYWSTDQETEIWTVFMSVMLICSGNFALPLLLLLFLESREFHICFEVCRSAIRVQADHPLECGDFYDPCVQQENVLRKTFPLLSAHGWRAGGASSPLFLPVHNEPRQNLIGKDSKKSLEWRVFARIDLPCLYNSVIFAFLRFRVHTGMFDFLFLGYDTYGYSAWHFPGCFRITWRQAARFGCFIAKESFKLEAWYTFNHLPLNR